jgi:hypothetical protein
MLVLRFIFVFCKPSFSDPSSLKKPSFTGTEAGAKQSGLHSDTLAERSPRKHVTLISPSKSEFMLLQATRNEPL